MKICKITYSIGVAFLFMISAVSIKAEIKSDSVTLSPFIGGYLFEGDQDLKHKPTYGLGLGYNFDSHWAAEAVFNYIDTKSTKGAGDVDGKLYHLDGLYHFSPSQNLVPYLAVGVGGLTLNPDRGSSDSDFIVNYGGGLKYFIKENIALRGDVRHILSFPENNLLYTVGLTFFFGGERKAVVEPPKDSDGDGVYDDFDKCPGTLAGVKVDSAGCPLDSDGDGVYNYLDKCPKTPAGVKVDSSGCPLDSDGDGVYDYLDKCLNTPKGVKVDKKGCPMDSDGDGVYDHMDQCPGTPTGATVDQRGCWVLKGVNFETAKWDIQPSGNIILDNVVTILKKNTSLKLEIQGHTDNRGSEAYNQPLSEKRAKAVMEYLVENGVEQSRLNFVGYGFSRPATSNDTAEGRAMNRRVELKPIQ